MACDHQEPARDRRRADPAQDRTQAAGSNARRLRDHGAADGRDSFQRGSRQAPAGQTLEFPTRSARSRTYPYPRRLSRPNSDLPAGATEPPTRTKHAPMPQPDPEMPTALDAQAPDAA